MNTDLLKDLTHTPGISGQEELVRALVKKALLDLTFSVTIDPMGNLIGHLPGKGPKLLIDAHMDEVGMMVQYIHDEGFIRFICIGGIDLETLYGQPVTIWGSEGSIPGIIGVPPPHMTNRKGDEKGPGIDPDTLFVDTGLSGPEVKERIAVGDQITFQAPWYDDGHVIQAKALDDRLGLFVMLEALSPFKEIPCDLYVVASAQEEIGLRGAAPVARRIKPDLVISIEATVANDLPGVPLERHLCRLGNGPEIRLSDGRFLAHRRWSEFIAAIAKESSIDHQIIVKKIGGTNAAVLQNAGIGAQSAVISIPVRYIHGPLGIARHADIKAAIRLLNKVITNIGRYEPILEP